MTIALTQTLPPNDVKIQFMEPYVSAGLNRKTEGIIPTGIFRGFTPSIVGMTVQLAGSVPQGDSIAVVSTLDGSGVPNFYNTTVRHEGNITVDFSAVPNGVYYLVLEVRYALISPVPLQGVTNFYVKAVNGGDLLPEQVILTRVTRAGALLTLDNTVRQDNGGPLATQTSVGGTNIAGMTLTSGSLNRFVAFNSPVPGTLVTFTSRSGMAQFSYNCAWINGNGSSFSVLESGLRIDGVDYSLAVSGIQNGAGSDQTIDWGQSGVLPLFLTAGSHSVELLASSAGSNGPWLLSAVAGRPATISVVYPGAPAPPAPSSGGLAVDAQMLTAGDFASAAYVPVPGTVLNFTTTVPNSPAVFNASVLNYFNTNLTMACALGFRVDGVTQVGRAEINFANATAGNSWHLTPMATMNIVSPGPHTVELMYSCVLNRGILRLNVTNPGFISCLHS